MEKQNKEILRQRENDRIKQLLREREIKKKKQLIEEKRKKEAEVARIKTVLQQRKQQRENEYKDFKDAIHIWKKIESPQKQDPFAVVIATPRGVFSHDLNKPGTPPTFVPTPVKSKTETEVAAEPVTISFVPPIPVAPQPRPSTAAITQETQTTPRLVSTNSASNNPFSYNYFPPPVKPPPPTHPPPTHPPPTLPVLVPLLPGSEEENDQNVFSLISVKQPSTTTSNISSSITPPPTNGVSRNIYQEESFKKLKHISPTNSISTISMHSDKKSPTSDSNSVSSMGKKASPNPSTKSTNNNHHQQQQFHHHRHHHHHANVSSHFYQRLPPVPPVPGTATELATNPTPPPPPLVPVPEQRAFSPQLTKKKSISLEEEKQNLLESLLRLEQICFQQKIKLQVLNEENKKLEDEIKVNLHQQQGVAQEREVLHSSQLNVPAFNPTTATTTTTTTTTAILTKGTKKPPRVLRTKEHAPPSGSSDNPSSIVDKSSRVAVPPRATFKREQLHPTSDNGLHRNTSSSTLAKDVIGDSSVHLKHRRKTWETQKNFLPLDMLPTSLEPPLSSDRDLPQPTQGQIYRTDKAKLLFG